MSREKRRGKPVVASVAGQPIDIENAPGGTLAVTGPLTDAQLRAAAVPVSGPLTDVQLRASAVPVTLSGGLPVTADLEVTGTVTANGQTVTIDCEGYACVALQIVSNAGELSFEHTVDGTNFHGCQLAYVAAGQAGMMSVAAVYTRSNGVWMGSCAGIKRIRVSSSGWGAGTATVTWRAIVAGGGRGPILVQIVDTGGTPGGTGLAVSGGAINVKLVDGVAGSAIGANETSTDTILPSGSQTHYTVRAYAYVFDGTNFIRVRGSVNEGMRVHEAKAATATRSDVPQNAANVTLLAANANRRGATIFNDAAAVLSVKFGATATVADRTLDLAAGAYYEVPFNYNGRIDGIWAAAGAGNARLTELTP